MALGFIRKPRVWEGFAFDFTWWNIIKYAAIIGASVWTEANIAYKKALESSRWGVMLWDLPPRAHSSLRQRRGRGTRARTVETGGRCSRCCQSYPGRWRRCWAPSCPRSAVAAAAGVGVGVGEGCWSRCLVPGCRTGPTRLSATEASSPRSTGDLWWEDPSAVLNEDEIKLLLLEQVLNSICKTFFKCSAYNKLNVLKRQGYRGGRDVEWRWYVYYLHDNRSAIQWMYTFGGCDRIG